MRWIWCVVGFCWAVPVQAQWDPRGADSMWARADCTCALQMEMYLEMYPNGRNVDDARRCLAQHHPSVRPPVVSQEIQEATERAFWDVLHCHNPEDMASYLELYPAGQYVEQAQRCLARTAPAPAPIVADAQGCLTPPGQCVTVREDWSPPQDFVTHYTNQCEGRLILKYCHELTYEGRQYDPHHCENMVLLPGQSTSWTTHRVTMRKGRPTGRYALQWTGSLRQENDALCRSKVPTWQEEPIY